MSKNNLQTRSVLADAIRSTFAYKAAVIGVPLAFASNAIMQPAIAQSADESESTTQASEDSSVTAMDEIVVRGKVTLRHNEAFSATKMNMDLKDIAQSVSVITQDLMEMADVQKFQDIFRVDASVGTSNRTDEFPTNFFRGFTIQGSNAIRVDGFRFPGDIDLDLATFERFELVKGPTSALFGQNSLGGTINAVTKQPTEEFGGEFGLEAGSFNSYRADLDLGGSLSSDGRWQYRFVGAYRDSDTYIAGASDDALVLAPSIAYDFSDTTRIVAALNYQDHGGSTHWGTGLQEFAPGQYRVLPTSREHNFGQSWNNRDSEVTLGTVKFEHGFDNGWTLRINAQGSTVDKTSLQCSADGNPDANGVLGLGCFTYYTEETDDLYGGEVNLIGDVSFMGREHTLFFGVDYTNIQGSTLQGFDYIDDNGDGYLDQYYNGGGVGYRLTPEPGAVHAEVGPEDLYYFYDFIDESKYAGVSLQALLNPTDNLQVLLSGRFTFDEFVDLSFRGGTYPDVLDGTFTSLPEFQNTTEEFIPQIGITYSISDSTNVYLNWGETYEPDSNGLRVFDPNDPAGSPLPPEKGEQIEIGLKADILDDRASISAAIFDMERSGLASPDRNNPAFFIPVGAQAVKGAEFSINGNINDAIDIFWSVAYLDAEYTKGDFSFDDVAPAGARPVNTPKFASSFFANYAVLDGPLTGLGIGVGWIYKDMYAGWGRVSNGGDASGGLAMDLGDISEVDLRVHYETDHWKYYVSVSDVFDETYYSPVRAEYRWGVSVNPGMRVRAGLKYRF
jgi:iron complex outermembrane recepter protein